MYLDVEPHLTLSDFKEVEKNLKVLGVAQLDTITSNFVEF